MLGPGMVVLGIAAAFGGSLYALRHAADHAFAIAALVVSTVELVGLLVLLVFILVSPV